MMALTDERGRLFGRVNLIDAGVGLLILLIAAGTFVGYRLLRLPVAPVVLKIEPEAQPAGATNMRLALRGQNFLPFMRVFVQRTGTTAAPLKKLDPKASGLDPFVLVNYSQGRFFAESPTIAEVWLPDRLGAGTYDLAFFNETQMIAVKQAAFTLTPPPPPPPPPPTAPRANILAYGAFIAVDRANPPRLAPGVRLPSGAADPWAEILEVHAPQTETALVRAPAGDIPAAVPSRMQVPAVLRVHCTVDVLNCNVPGANITVGNSYPIQVGDRTLNFYVEDMGPDAVEVVRDAIVEVRFVTKPEVARLVRAGDTDSTKAPTTTRLRRPAVLRARSAAEQSSVAVTQSDGGQSFQLEGQVVAFTAKIEMTLMQMPTGWFYRAQSIKAGNSLTFDTFGYTVRGIILGVDLGKAGESRRSSLK